MPTLYNGDCTFLFGRGYQVGEGPYTAEVFHRFIDLLADHGVDTYLCNPQAQKPWYPSKVTPSVLEGYRRGDKEFFRGHYPPANDTDLPAAKLDAILADQAPFLNRYLDLAEAGVDWVAEISQACRRRGVAPWLSVRMNDLHGANSWEGSYMNASVQKEPRFRLRGNPLHPGDPVDPHRQAMDYAHSEVRDYTFAVIRELVEDYDFEGLELDWLRTPHCLEPTASQAGIDLMTGWIASIRDLTRRRSEATGKPYPLGLRIPPRLGMLRAIGLDVPAMARSGLIDFVCPSNFWQTSWDLPYDRLRGELGVPASRLAIYGVVEDAPNWMEALDPTTGARGYRLLSASPELLRGNAAGKLALGADAIETFNFFCSDEEGIHPTAAPRQARYDALRGLGDLEALRGQPKHYALSSMLGHYMYPEWEYAEGVPAILEPGWKRAFTLGMAAEPAGMDLVIQVVTEKPEENDAPAPKVGVSFNGSWPSFDATPTDRLLFSTGAYTHHVPEHRAVNFRLPADLIREGWNEVLVFNGSRERGDAEARRRHSLHVVGVELGVMRP